MQNGKTLLMLRVGSPAPTTAAAETAAAMEAYGLGYRVLLAEGGMDGLLEERLFVFDGTALPGADFRSGGHLGSGSTDVLFEYTEKDWTRFAAVIAAHGITDLLVMGDRSGAALGRHLAAAYPSLAIGYLPLDVTNSVSGTHHSLGYGSGAKRVAADAAEIASTIQASFGESPGGVYEIPENDSGYLALSAALGRSGDGCAVDMQFIPEVPFDLGETVMDIIFRLHDTGKCLVVFSHGLRWKSGKPFFHDASMTKDGYGRGYEEDMNSFIAGHIKAVSSKTFSYRADITAGGFTRVLSAFDKAESEAAAVFAVKALLGGERSFGVSLPAPGGEMKAAPIGEFDALLSVPEEFYDREAQRASEAFLLYAAPLILGEAYAPTEAGLPLMGRLGGRVAEKKLPAVEKKTGFLLAELYERKPKR